MEDRFFITGSTGFVGANVVRALVKQHKEVYVITRQKALGWRLADIARDIHLVTGDIRDPKLHEIIKTIHPSHIFHLATYGAYPHEEDLDQMVDTNIKGTANLLEACKKINFSLFINTSSTSEYGIKDAPMRETDILTPVNDYGITKAAATLYCQKEARRNNLPIITLRLFSVYGPFEAKKRLIPTLVAGAVKNMPIALSKPENVRDYVYIEDAIAAYMQASDKIHDPGSIYNIGTGVQTNTRDVADMVLSLSKSTSELLWGKVAEQGRQMEPALWVADNTKANNVFGWKPRYTLRNGLSETIAWFRTHGGLYE